MTNEKDLINEHIFSLKYDPKTVMVFTGTKIGNLDARSQDSFEDGDYLVVTREKCSYESELDIAVPGAFNDVTYPGALLVASDELLDGKPQALACARAPLRLTVDLPGSSDLSFTTPPAYADVQAGVNEILAKWFKDHGHEWSLPADFHFRSSLIYDENQLALKFGCDVEYLKQKLGIDFSRTREEKKSIYIVQYKQIFYTVSAERPSSPADVFGESAKWENLSHYVSEVHPPLLVKNVQYGRQIFLKFESTLSSSKLEAVITAQVNADGLSVGGHGSTTSEDDLKKINVSLVVLGGSEEVYSDLTLAGADDVRRINKIIFENAKLSPKNPAAPLNYHTVYLKDGVSAGVHGKSEYIEEKTERFSGGTIKLEHHGWYTAQFTIEWDEIYFEGDVRKTRKVGWDGNGKDQNINFKTEIPLRGNARKICIKARGCTGWAGEYWRTSGNKENLALVPERKVLIGGTCQHQTFDMNPAA